MPVRVARIVKVTLVVLAAFLAVLALVLWRQPRPLLLGLSPAICPQAVYYFATDEPIVALTIDDAPSAATADILRVLAENDARATFFLLGDRVNSNNRFLLAEMIAAGHELGNHLLRDEPSIALAPLDFLRQFVQADRRLRAFAPVGWFRPGSGWCSGEMVAIAERAGYAIALGSIWPYDTHLPFPRLAVNQILSNLHPGAIIILHDAGENDARGRRTVAILARVLPELKQRGYRAVTLATLARSGKAVANPNAIPEWGDRWRVGILRGLSGRDR